MKMKNEMPKIEKREKFGWVSYVVITRVGSEYICGSLATAEKLVENLKKAIDYSAKWRYTL